MSYNVFVIKGGNRAMLLNKNTKQIQEALGKFVKTGDTSIIIEGANKNRLPHYRRLVLNVVKDSLSSAYPLSKELLGETQFDELCEEFFAKHNCQEQQVYKMTKELVDFIEAHLEHPLLRKYPYLKSLLAFEWLEMELYMMPNVSVKTKEIKIWRDDVIAINPESRIIELAYPVHKIPVKQLKEEQKGSYYCMAHRQAETFKVIFNDLSPILSVIVSLVKEQHSLKTIFTSLRDNDLELEANDEEAVIQFFQSQIESGLVLGARC